MTESRIEQLAEAVLAGHGLRSLPVDPMALARLEKIWLLPGRYDGCLDGRIEYRYTLQGGRFYLFYAQEQPGRRPISRVRFSVAHELGHFFLPIHRSYLLSGHYHGSRSEFLSVRRVEREADWFAAALLMPRGPFTEHVQRRGEALFTLKDLARLADRVFKTSLTSTAIRYVQLNFEPCCVLLSQEGRFLLRMPSGEMKRLGYGWIRKIPAQSLTGRLLAGQKLSRPGELVDAAVWFPGRTGPLWEEVRILGGTGRILTFLVLNETEAPESA